MAKIENTQNSDAESKLEGILYQFVNLYERWSEDRQVTARQRAKVAELVEKFTQQVAGFKKLEAKVKEQLATSINEAFSAAIDDVSASLSKTATVRAQETLEQLEQAAHDANEYLQSYRQYMQQEQKHTFWKTLGIALISSVVIGFLIVKLYMPQNIVNLTKEQLTNISIGQMETRAWPNLSSKERSTILNLLDKAQKGE